MTAATTEQTPRQEGLISRAINNFFFNRELKFLTRRAPLTNNPYGLVDRMELLMYGSHNNPSHRLQVVTTGMAIADTLTKHTDGGPAAELYRGLAMFAADDHNPKLREIMLEKGPALAAKIRFRPSIGLMTDTMNLLQTRHTATKAQPIAPAA